MLFANHALARRLEAIEARGIADYPAAQSRLNPHAGGTIEPAAGGFAVFAGLHHPLSKAVGMGLNGPVTADEMDRLEEFYRSRGAQSAVELCPLADPSLIELLRERGYRLTEFDNVWFRELASDERLAVEASDFIVREIRPDEAAMWARTVAQGFAGSEDDFEQDLKIAAPHFYIPANTLFLALVGDEPVGGGVIYIHDRVAALFSGSTRPAFLHRGVQTALLRARIQRGIEAGCELAVIKTSPGTASQRNVERAGFRLAYTKASFARDFNY
jgi:GNAT superfamily N-acetyltransferase